MPSVEAQMSWRRVHMYDRAYYALKSYWLMYSPCAPTVLYMSESVWGDAIGGGLRCAAVDFTTGRPVAFEAVMISDYRFDSLRTKNPCPYDFTRWGVVYTSALSRWSIVKTKVKAFKKSCRRRCGGGSRPRTHAT